MLSKAIEQAAERGFLGANISGSDFSFDISIKSGAGAYVCGEEFALIESLEGNAGRPRNKPPFPTVSGIYNKPTLINNVETFANIPFIIANGADEYLKTGVAGSPGTKLVCLSGNLNNRGVCEVPFGLSLKDIILNIGGGVPGKRKIKMVQVGGQSGPVLPERMLDIKMDYDSFAAQGISMGTGAVTVIDERFDMIEIVRQIMKFFKNESCGKCTPCREGNRQMLRILYKFSAGTAEYKDIKLLETLGEVMKDTSFCGLGSAAPTAVQTTIKYFRDENVKRKKNAIKR